MSYEAGTATNIADLFTKLSTFAVANGWTQDHAASDRLFLTRSTCSVAFRWSTTTPTCAGVYQHTAFISSGTDPGNHTNDSGQGNISGTNATLLTGRHVPLVDSTMRYWFFEFDTYLHIVAEGAGTLTAAHFGFGILDKRGTWTGGEYAYGWRIDPAGGTGDSAIRSASTHLLDGLAAAVATRPFVATVHCEGLPNQTASGKWGLAWGGVIADTSTDRGGTARESLQGGFRGGPVARTFGRHGGSINSGIVPIYPVGVWYDDRTLARWHELGWMLDVRGVNMRNFAFADEIAIGADTWVVFPSRYKTSVSSSGSTRNQGIAYKKVTI